VRNIAVPEFHLETIGILTGVIGYRLIFLIFYRQCFGAVRRRRSSKKAADENHAENKDQAFLHDILSLKVRNLQSPFIFFIIRLSKSMRNYYGGVYYLEG
jgi:hypothetical protein